MLRLPLTYLSCTISVTLRAYNRKNLFDAVNITVLCAPVYCRNLKIRNFLMQYLVLFRVVFLFYFVVSVSWYLVNRVILINWAEMFLFLWLWYNWMQLQLSCKRKCLFLHLLLLWERFVLLACDATKINRLPKFKTWFIIFGYTLSFMRVSNCFFWLQIIFFRFKYICSLCCAIIYQRVNQFNE